MEEKLKVIEKSQARCELDLFLVNSAYAAQGGRAGRQTGWFYRGSCACVAGPWTVGGPSEAVLPRGTKPPDATDVSKSSNGGPCTSFTSHSRLPFSPRAIFPVFFARFPNLNRPLQL